MNAESDRRVSPAIAIVVNDDPTQLDVLVELTRKAGLEPRPFTKAEEALQAMEPNAPPDIVVTDLYMHGIDGWRFCRLLRSPEYSAFNHIPILVVSATFAGEEPRRIAAGIGADAFMGAPVDGKRFVEQVRMLLDGRPPRPHPRALITSDSKALAADLQNTFAADGYEVHTALTAQEAAAAFEETGYNVAILDHHLSGEEGGALLDAFRARRPDCVCVMMTADPTPELALAWMKRGASAYVRKPFESAYLVELCDKARGEQFLLHTRDLLELRTQELKQSEQRYRRITQTIHSYVYTVRIEDGDPVEIKHGPGCQAITGYDETEFEADPFLWLRIIVDADRRKVIQQVRAVFSGAHPPAIEYRIIRKDGETRWVRNTYVPQYNAHGVLVAYDGLIQDITERKQAEQALTASEEKYRAIVQQMSDGMYLHDLDGAFLEVNDAAVAASGYSKSELLGLNVVDLDPDRALREEVRRIWEEMPVGYLRGFRTEHRRKDGSRYPCELTISKISFGGRDYILALARDITEREKAEAAL
ncbi:MAG: PAS domain S-box protein, partial [Candidatus Hydrogenedentota bacterium]